MVNADLKKVGERAKISTPLTTYVARHSFATALRQKGTATAVISQAMGHKTEAVTAIYLDSFASEIVDSAYDALL
jgi:site-specific recombinase XerD